MFMHTAMLVINNNILTLVVEFIALLEVQMNKYFPSTNIFNND